MALRKGDKVYYPEKDSMAVILRGERGLIENDNFFRIRIIRKNDLYWAKKEDIIKANSKLEAKVKMIEDEL